MDEPRITHDERMRLNILMNEMYQCFIRIARVRDDKNTIERYIGLMDEHQTILSQVSTRQYLEGVDGEITMGSGKKNNLN